MRGKGMQQSYARVRMGITPAYAGKRGLEKLFCHFSKDHPRVCGEKRKDRLDYYVPQGSPPRMRGKD